MDKEDIYYIWDKLKDYISVKDREEACYCFLSDIAERYEDAVITAKNTAVDEGDTLFVKQANLVIKEFGIDECDWE